MFLQLKDSNIQICKLHSYNYAHVYIVWIKILCGTLKGLIRINPPPPLFFKGLLSVITL